MRGMMLSAAMVLALTGGSIVNAEVELPTSTKLQRPAPGRGPGKPAEEKKPDAEKKDDAEKKADGEKKPEGEVAKAEDGKWVEKKIEKLPEANKEATAALKKAWDSVYSPQAKGLKKLAADVTMNMKADLTDMGMGPIDESMDFKLSWVAGEAVSFKLIEDPNAVDASGVGAMVRQGLKTQSKSVEGLMTYVIGWTTFDATFKDKVAVEESKTDKTQVIRVWEKRDDSFVSTLYTIENGDIVRIFNADRDSKFEYAKKGRDKFISKSTDVRQATGRSMGGRGGMPGMQGPIESAFTFDERGEVKGIQVVSKFASKVNMMITTADLGITVKNMKANEDVTQELIDAAKDIEPAKAEEKPAEPADKKPAETGSAKKE